MTGLVVTASGMVTAVGLDAPSSCAALRARIAGFDETRFVGPGGAWLVGAPVPLSRQWIGEKRSLQLVGGAIAEVLRADPGVGKHTGLILCLAEEGRPGRPIRDAQTFVRKLSDLLGLSSEVRTRIIQHGRPSGVAALERARRLHAEGGADRVVIAGVDSYLTGRAVSHYLGENRLLTPDNAEGFIPGEAAAAVLCEPRGRGLRVAGLGLARETAPIFNGKDEDGLDLPLRADGMVAAYTRAFAEAGLGHHDVRVKIGDQTGESFFFRQTALAMTRTQRVRSEVHPIWPIAASLGNVGAAAVPVMLGWALAAVRKGYSENRPLLIEASGDDGACGALVAVAA